MKAGKEMSKGIVRIEFKTDNAAFEDYRAMAIADILHVIEIQIAYSYQTEGVIRDVNGNAIGTWTTEGTEE